VKNYVSNLLIKLGMKHRTDAAVFAVRVSQHEQRFGADNR
jgi:DNA-binding NarL/FixJ family response regulator